MLPNFLQHNQDHDQELPRNTKSTIAKLLPVKFLGDSKQLVALANTEKRNAAVESTLEQTEWQAE
jgi:hypothetical protein